MIPKGNGYFVWLLERTAGGNPVAMAKQAKEAGLEWIALKVADGAYVVNQSRDGKIRDLIGPAVDALRDQGISVYGWHYVYGYDPKGEAGMAIRQTLQYGLDGYIIDAEGEYKNRPAQAELYMRELRKGLGSSKSIGICSFRFPFYHQEFPWDAFKSCDFNMPQVYWMMATNSAYQLQRTEYEYKAIGYRLPIIPVGAAFSEWGWTAQPAEVIVFRKMAHELGMPGYGWWEWWDATERHPELWEASVRKLDVAPAEPVKVTKQLVTQHKDLRIRSGPGTGFSILGFMVADRRYNVVKIQGDWARLDGTSERWVHTGYVTLLDVESDDTPQPPMPKAKQVMTKYSDLRARSGPGLNFGVVGYMTANKTYNVVEEQGVWGRLEGEERWVHLGYCVVL